MPNVEKNWACAGSRGENDDARRVRIERKIIRRCTEIFRREVVRKYNASKNTTVAIF